jgi:hypothetical protein
MYNVIKREMGYKRTLFQKKTTWLTNTSTRSQKGYFGTTLVVGLPDGLTKHSLSNLLEK